MPAKVPASPAEPEWLTPDELKTWRALHLLLQTLPSALGAQLQRDSELSLFEYYVLAILSDQPHHTIRMSQLAILANSELSRLSHLMHRMEKRGLVRRQPDSSDGRFTHAILTAGGRAQLRMAAPGHVAHVRQLIFEVLNMREQHALRRAAEKITRELANDC
jgi:DNA-binding MarR family transcriptional regulator